MRKKSGIQLSAVCGQKMLIATGIENIDMNNVIKLNETAAFLWEAMGDDEFTVEDLVKKLTSEYTVSDEKAKESIEGLLADMRKVGIIID